MFRHLALPALISVAFVACDSAEAPHETDDPESSSFGLSGKADDPTWHTTTLAVLEVANTLPRRDLQRAIRRGGAGLGLIPAGNIARNRPFLTIGELDAVPFVGPKALGKLIDYAVAHKLPGAPEAPLPNVPECANACRRIASSYETDSQLSTCQASCNLLFSSREDLCGSSVDCDDLPESRMVSLYQSDTELVTFFDEDLGVVRVDHTLTAYANRTASRARLAEADSLEAERGAATPSARDDLEAEIKALRRQARHDSAEAAFHSFMSGLNQLTGRE